MKINKSNNCFASASIVVLKLAFKCYFLFLISLITINLMSLDGYAVELLLKS